MNETVAIAAQLMRASNISALVVKDVVRTEGNTAVGMFTERDVVRAIAEKGAAGVNMKVSQLISVQQAGCLFIPATTLEHVRHLMNRAPHPPSAGDRQFRLVGVISMRDISSAFDDSRRRRVDADGGLTRPLSSGGPVGFERRAPDAALRSCMMALPAPPSCADRLLPDVTPSCP